MKQFLSVLMSVCMAIPATAAKQKQTTILNEPMEVYVAEAAANTLKRVNTVSGFLAFAETFADKKEMAALKKWIQAQGIPKDAVFPEYKVKGSKIYYGRDSVTINKDHILVNKKKYPIKHHSLTSFVAQVCKDLKCGKSKSANLDSLIFTEADAFGWFALGLAFVAGVVLHRPARRLWRGITGLFRGRRNREVAGGAFVREEIRNREVDEGYHCQSGHVYLERTSGGTTRAFNREGERIRIPPGALEDGLSCEDNARLLNAAVQQNERNGIDEPLDGFRSVTSEKNNKPKKNKKVKSK